MERKRGEARRWHFGMSRGWKIKTGFWEGIEEWEVMIFMETWLDRVN